MASNNTDNRIDDKNDKTFFMSKVLLYSFFLLAIFRIILSIIESNAEDDDYFYSLYCLPEIMINYQGGFVRRGIFGELFYQLFLLHPYPVHLYIIYVESFILVAFLILSCYIFRKLQIAPIMPFAILVGSVTLYRRDFLMILMAFVVFYLLTQYLKHHKLRHLITSVILMTLAILTYEPVFFFVIPICILIYYQNSVSTRSKRIVHTAIVFVAPIITMAIVCISKGTAEQANAIWHSWAPLFNFLNFKQPHIPEAIDFLSISDNLIGVFKYHIGLNFCDVEYENGIDYLRIIGSILFFICTYMLTIAIPSKRFSKTHTTQLSSIYLFQLICLLPMFTLLSCDYGRTILYVIFSSYYLQYLLNANGMRLHIPYLNSEQPANIIAKFSQPKLLLFNIVILLLMPFNLWGGILVTHPFIINIYDLIKYKGEYILFELGIL